MSDDGAHVCIRCGDWSDDLTTHVCRSMPVDADRKPRLCVVVAEPLVPAGTAYLVSGPVKVTEAGDLADSRQVFKMTFGSEPDPHACLPPPDLDRWCRSAAEFNARTVDAVGFVMHHTNGRANPQEVAARITALRVEFPIHLIDAERSDNEDTLTHCDGDDHATSAAIGPKTNDVALVTCADCLGRGQAYADRLAADIRARRGALS